PEPAGQGRAPPGGPLRGWVGDARASGGPRHRARARRVTAAGAAVHGGAHRSPLTDPGRAIKFRSAAIDLPRALGREPACSRQTAVAISSHAKPWPGTIPGVAGEGVVRIRAG